MKENIFCAVFAITEKIVPTNDVSCFKRFKRLNGQRKIFNRLRQCLNDIIFSLFGFLFSASCSCFFEFRRFLLGCVRFVFMFFHTTRALAVLVDSLARCKSYTTIYDLDDFDVHALFRRLFTQACLCLCERDQRELCNDNATPSTTRNRLKCILPCVYTTFTLLFFFHRKETHAYRARTKRERKTENIDTPNCSQITNTFIISTGRLERPEKNKIQSNEMIDTEHKKNIRTAIFFLYAI